MPTDEEMNAAVQAAIDKAKAEADERVKAASNGKFTQEDVDRIAGEARKDGRSSAERELLKGLGVENLEAAKSAIEAAKTLEDEKKTELQRVQEEAARFREEAESAKAEARNSRIVSATELALRDAGINPERVNAALRLVDLSKLDVKGADVSGLAEAVTTLKTESPEWFGPPVSPPNASLSNGAPVDFKTASADERDKALAQYGIRL